MHTKKTSAQLKQAARGIMLGKYRNAISILLASDLIINTISVMSATSNESYVGIIIGLAISFILVLLGAILNVGQCSFYLNVACNQKYEFSNLFTGFKVHPDKIIITQVIIQLLTILPLLPAIGVMWYSFKAYNIIVVFLIGCLLLILGAGLQLLGLFNHPDDLIISSAARRSGDFNNTAAFLHYGAGIDISAGSADHRNRLTRHGRLDDRGFSLNNPSVQRNHV